MGAVCGFYSNCLVIIFFIIMRVSVLILCVVIVVGAGKREILRRHGDYFLRLGNENGKLVLDEGDILPMDTPLEAPMQYKRSKRIAHVKDYEKFVNEQDKYDYLSNDVNVDSPRKDLAPAASQPDFVGIQGMLESGSVVNQAGFTAQDLAIAQMYQKDTSHCLQKYLCEISATSKENLLMEETALLAMIQSQSDISSLLTANLGENQSIRRLRRSAKSIDAALQEAARVGQFCHKRFPDCKISRIDILKVYKEQKESFCSLPMPYGM